MPPVRNCFFRFKRGMVLIYICVRIHIISCGNVRTRLQPAAAGGAGWLCVTARSGAGGRSAPQPSPSAPLRSAAHREPRRSARRPSRCRPACLLVHTVRTGTGHALRAPPEIRRTRQGPSAPVGRQHPLLRVQRFRSLSGKRVKTPEGGSSVAIPEPERAVRPLVPRAQPGAGQGAGTAQGHTRWVAARRPAQQHSRRSSGVAELQLPCPAAASLVLPPPSSPLRRSCVPAASASLLLALPDARTALHQPVCWPGSPQRTPPKQGSTLPLDLAAASANTAPSTGATQHRCQPVAASAGGEVPGGAEQTRP